MTSYNYSYNVLINRLEAFAAGHFLIKRFTHGQIDLADQLQDDQYPFMHVTPDTITPVQGGMQFGFMIMFADIPRDKEYKAEYQREVISDCIRLGQDLIAEIRNGLQLFGFDVQLVSNPTFEPFIEEYKNTVTGVAFTIQLEVPWDWSACDIPAVWTVGGTSSGGGGTGYGIILRTNGVDNAVQNILDLVEGTNVTITDNGDGSVTIDAAGGGGGGELVSTEFNVNHTTATGNPYVIGDRVWYNGNVYRCIANNDALLPTNTTYWTLVGVGYRLRQTPVDWNATSGDYQILNKPTIPAAQVNSDWDAVSGVEEILNKPTLATVATTGSYTDLINQPTIPAAQIQSDWTQANTGLVDYIKNKPTIPAAQVNSDWNATSGVAEILNKPFIPVNLDDLADVNAPTPSNGQVLTYNTTSGDWEAATPSAGGSGTVTSVGLTMPAPTNAAFSVTGSPVTTSGTLAVGANGTVDQYIDGTGALRTLPSTGGGGGQIFYFNGNVSQGTIGGNAYYQLGTAAGTGPAANFTRATTGAIARFITDVGSPNHVLIPAGVWTIDVYLSESGGGSNHAQILAKLYKYNGSTFTLIATSTMEEITNGNVPDLYSFTISVPTTVTAATDRVHIEFDIQNTNGKTVTLYTEASRIGEVHTTYAIGISSLNGLTENTQNFAEGTAGTDFDIVSAGNTHTFNLPTASAANRGALSSADWSTFNGKQNTVGFTTVGTAIATIPNPSAIRYLRINADNSVTAITAATLKSELLAATPYGVVAYGSAFVATVPASTTTYGTITSGTIAFNTNISNREFTIPFGGTVKNLYLHTSNSQGAGGSLVVTVMQNQIATSLAITVPALGLAQTRTNLTDSFTAVAGDKLVFRFVNNHTNVSATIVSVSFIIEQL
jgi:hypothetical protein